MVPGASGKGLPADLWSSIGRQEHGPGGAIAEFLRLRDLGTGVYRGPPFRPTIRVVEGAPEAAPRAPEISMGRRNDGRVRDIQRYDRGAVGRQARWIGAK